MNNVMPYARNPIGFINQYLSRNEKGEAVAAESSSTPCLVGRLPVGRTGQASNQDVPLG